MFRMIQTANRFIAIGGICFFWCVSITIGSEPTGSRDVDKLPLGAIVRLGRCPLDVMGEALHLAFSPDGDRLAVAAGDLNGAIAQIRVFDMRSGDASCEPLDNRGAQMLMFTSDGKRLLSGRAAWDVATWTKLPSSPDQPLVAASADGRWGASLDEQQPNKVKIWNLTEPCSRRP